MKNVSDLLNAHISYMQTDRTIRFGQFLSNEYDFNIETEDFNSYYEGNDSLVYAKAFVVLENNDESFWL